MDDIIAHYRNTSEMLWEVQPRRLQKQLTIDEQIVCVGRNVRWSCREQGGYLKRLHIEIIDRVRCLCLICKQNWWFTIMFQWAILILIMYHITVGTKTGLCQ